MEFSDWGSLMNLEKSVNDFLKQHSQIAPIKLPKYSAHDVSILVGDDIFIFGTGGGNGSFQIIGHLFKISDPKLDPKYLERHQAGYNSGCSRRDTIRK